MVPMRPLNKLPTVMIALCLVGMASTTVLAGSPSSPDITDASGDAQVDGAAAGSQNAPPGPLTDATDITGVWYTFVDPMTLEVGFAVTALPDDSTMGNDAGSVEYSTNFILHRPADNTIPGWEEAFINHTVTITTGLNADSAVSCSGDAANKSVGDDTVSCTLSASTFGLTVGNGTFYDGDMVMNGTADSIGTVQDAANVMDSAGPQDSAYILQGMKEKPDSVGGGGGNGTGPGSGGGGNTTGGGSNPESTPGFGAVAVAASLGIVALVAAARRER